MYVAATCWTLRPPVSTDTRVQSAASRTAFTCPASASCAGERAKRSELLDRAITLRRRFLKKRAASSMISLGGFNDRTS